MIEDIITTINVNGKELALFYDKMENYLASNFTKDEDMEDYIRNNVDTVFNAFVVKKAENKYLLNIASTEDFGYFEWDTSNYFCCSLLTRQMLIFMPIIQKFILLASTDKL